MSCLKYSEAELQISQSNATNSTRAEQAIKLVYETCIYSTAWLKMRFPIIILRRVIIYSCFLAKQYLVLIKVMMSFGPYEL